MGAGVIGLQVKTFNNHDAAAFAACCAADAVSPTPSLRTPLALKKPLDVKVQLGAG